MNTTNWINFWPSWECAEAELNSGLYLPHNENNDVAVAEGFVFLMKRKKKGFCLKLTTNPYQKDIQKLLPSKKKKKKEIQRHHKF